MPNPPEPDVEILASEVPRKFGQILSDLLRGKSYTVVRYGQPVARIVTPVEKKVRK